MGRKDTKFCAILNYIEHFLILASTITGCISISAFGSLLGISIEIMSSTVLILLRICVIAAIVKKYKSIIKNRIVSKIYIKKIQVLISKDIIDSNISHDELVLINNVRKDCDHKKEEMKTSKTKSVYLRF